MGYFFLLKLIKFNMKKINITEAKFNKEYLICDILIREEKLKKHLKNLFIKHGEKIKVLKKSYMGKSYIIKVLGINYATEKEVCEKIIVYDC